MMIHTHLRLFKTIDYLRLSMNVYLTLLKTIDGYLSSFANNDKHPSNDDTHPSLEDYLRQSLCRLIKSEFVFPKPPLQVINIASLSPSALRNYSVAHYLASPVSETIENRTYWKRPKDTRRNLYNKAIKETLRISFNTTASPPESQAIAFIYVCMYVREYVHIYMQLPGLTRVADHPQHFC